jgi:sugar lactone lactonase YvrE
MTTLFTNRASRSDSAESFVSSARGAWRHKNRACDGCLFALGMVLAVLLSGTGLAHAQTPPWTKIATNGTKKVTDCLLLTDGTVMCQLGETTNQLVRLTPDKTGSYVNGSWSTTNITSLPASYQPRFFCSVVLPDGRVIYEGGEYNPPSGAGQVETNLGYIFDPTLNSGKGQWDPITPPDNGAAPWNEIGDSPCIVLANGTFILGNNGSKQMAALDPITLTYTDLNPTGKADAFNEEGWTLLPDGTILTVDTGDVPNSEIYDPTSNSWSSAGSTGVTLSGNGSEIGPAVLVGDKGYLIQFGATPDNATYMNRQWVPVQSFPIPFVCGGTSYENAGVNDGPASILPNGNVLVAANPIVSGGNAEHCAVFFEFDGTNLNPVPEDPGDTDAPTKPAFGLRMLALPSGDVMVEDGSANVWFYNNGQAADPVSQPTITSALSGVVPGKTYPISGTLFNGVSQGAMMGDDGEWETNYPLVRFTQGTSVTYARTHNHSSMGVNMPYTKVTTYFDVPANLGVGAYNLEVVANGIPSAPLPVNVVGTGSTLLYDGGSLAAYGNDMNVGALLNSTGTSQPPITGATVAFQVGSQSCSGTTDPTGFAGCTIVGNQTPGDYTVTANFAGNSSYGASSTSSSFTIIPAIQSITFTTNAPSSAATDSSFTVAASASSGLPVAYTSSGQCSNVGANYTMGSDTGTCTVIANQAGDADYVAAPTVTESVTVTAATVRFAYAQFTVPASGLKSPDGVAVDGAGDVFIADESNNRVVKVSPSGAQTTVGSGLSGPDGVAVDGAGDVFIADFANNRVVEVTPSGVQTTVAGTGATPTGVAVDAAGDVFTAAYGEQEVLETPAGCTSSSCVKLVWGSAGGTTVLLPLGVAVDKAGNVFFPVTGTSAGVIKQAPPYNTGVYSFIGSGLNGPTGVAVDAAGDVFIADTGNNRVVELPVGGGSQTTVGSTLTNANGVAVDGAGDVLVSEGSSNLAIEVQREAVNFGYVNVCPAGQSSPAPCKESLTLNYVANGTATVASINVGTQGAANLDFTLTSNSCIGTLTSGSTCLVTATFSPLAPGARPGAVQLDGVGTVLATTFVHGEGKAPAIAFGPGTQVILPTSGLNAPASVTVDALGDVFIPDRANNQVVELPAGCNSGSCQITLPVLGLSDPSDVAVDGEGNIYITDTLNNRVAKLMPIAVGYDYATVGSGLTLPTAVAVDGAGNVFIATNGDEVVEVPAGGGPQITLVTGLAFPAGVAVDGAGNVYVADNGNNRVLEVPAGCISSTCEVTVPAIGLNGAAGVAVDGAGDVYITDQNNNRVVEVPAGGSPQTTVMSGLNLPEGIAVDGAGDVFIADEANQRVVEVRSSQPPILNFGTTNLGSTSAPQSVSVQNIGNQPLNAVSPGLVVKGPNFLQVAGSGTPADCTSSFALAPGTTCNLSISFQPQSGGSLTSTATFTDNALNTSPSVSQGIALQGTGTQAASVTVGTSPAGLAFSVDGTNYPGPQSFTWTIGSVHTIATTATQTPSAGVQDSFTSWSDGGALSHSVTASASTTSYTANFNTAYLLTTAANPASGGTVTPASGTYYAANTVVTLTAKKKTGYVFSGWSGNVANALIATTTVTMNAPQAVSANFVKPATTVTLVASNLNPSIYGQSVILTATVTASDGTTATGKVTFDNGTKSLGTATLSGGVAVITTSTLPAGTLTITASYDGDTTHVKSKSSALTQVVDQATSTTVVVSSLNPSTTGKLVKFTATVTSPTTKPTGTVTFTDGSTALGTETLASGKASYSSSTLSAGSHNITAVYQGNADCAASTSAVLLQTVNP